MTPADHTAHDAPTGEATRPPRPVLAAIERLVTVLAYLWFAGLALAFAGFAVYVAEAAFTDPTARFVAEMLWTWIISFAAWTWICRRDVADLIRAMRPTGKGARS